MIEQFRLYITTDNDAFQESEYGVEEIARILRDTADKLEQDISVHGRLNFHWYQTLRDNNGNDVGRAGLKPLEEELHLPEALLKEEE